MSDELTDAERHAIEQAIASGRIKRVGRLKREVVPPAVDWDHIPRRMPSRDFDRTPARRVYGGEVSVLQILEWAFRVEQARLELPELKAEYRGWGFGMEYVMIERARLGCTVDGGGGQSYPHEDAEAVAAIVSNLPDHLGGIRQAVRVAEYARSGGGPDWLPGVTPRIEPIEWLHDAYGRRAKAEVLEEIRVRINGKMRPRVVQWCPVHLVPSVATIERARMDYRDWWMAICDIRDRLRLLRLRTFSVNLIMPRIEPWARR